MTVAFSNFGFVSLLDQRFIFKQRLRLDFENTIVILDLKSKLYNSIIYLFIFMILVLEY